MDQNGLSSFEISSKHNHHLFTKRTLLQFLVPVSLLSFLISCTSGFPFFFAYNFKLFPLLAHAFERKYMFLICNGILAFLVKTLPTSSLSSSDLNDINDSPATVNEAIISDQGFVSESSLDVEKPQQEEAEAVEVDRLEGKGNRLLEIENEGIKPITPGACIIGDAELQFEEDKEQEEELEEGCGALAMAEEEMDVNINTEELNKKIEEFIRKMKEELRIQAQQQQLVTV